MADTVKTNALVMGQEYITRLVAAESKTAGLADEFHNAAVKLYEETDSDRQKTDGEKLAEFDTFAKKLEDQARQLVDESGAWEVGTPLSDALPNFRNVKSVYRNGIKSGVDPRDYPTWSKYRQAKLAAGKPSSGKSGEKDAPDGGGQGDPSGDGGNVAAMPSTSGLTEAAQKAVYAAIKTLEQMDEASQNEVAENFCKAAKGKLNRLSKANPKFAKAANA